MSYGDTVRVIEETIAEYRDGNRMSKTDADAALSSVLRIQMIRFGSLLAGGLVMFGLTRELNRGARLGVSIVTAGVGAEIMVANNRLDAYQRNFMNLDTPFGQEVRFRAFGIDYKQPEIDSEEYRQDASELFASNDGLDDSWVETGDEKTLLI